MELKFRKVKKFLLDLFFPSFCVGCGSEGSLLCLKCKKGIISVQLQTCPGCSRINSNGVYCSLCRFETFMVKKKNKKKPQKTKRRKSLQGIIVAAYYEEGPIKEMIHNFKYNHALELKKILSNLLVRAYRSHSEYSGVIASGSAAIHDRLLRLTPRNDDILITFAPLHHRRLAERGFNQAEILAHETAKKLKLPCCETLIKIKSTKRQVGLTGAKRRENLKEAFKINQSLSSRGGAVAILKDCCMPKGVKTRNDNADFVKDKTIIIIDDITTTGTTLNECARVLKSAGAKEVWGLVVARG